MAEPRFPWPQRTTAWAGALLLVAAVLQLAVAVRMALPIMDQLDVPFAGDGLDGAAAVARAAAFVVAAVGIAGEIGVAGGSRWGRVALTVYGCRDLVLLVVGAMPMMGVAVGTALQLFEVLTVVAGVVAAIAVRRAGVLGPVARTVVLVVVIVDGLYTLLQVTPVIPVQLALLALPTEFLRPALSAALGITLLAWGRMEAVKHRARTTLDAW